MHRRWIRSGFVPVLTLAVALAGCDSGGDIQGLEATESASLTVVAANGHGTPHGHQPQDAHSVEKVIGREGGELNLAGHSLVIPEDAVDRPTLFRMTLLDEEGIIVDLSAQALEKPGSGERGEKLENGHSGVGDKGYRGRGWKRGGGEVGFDGHVILTLSYAGLDVDPNTVAVVWLPSADPHAPAHRIDSTVNEDARTVSAYLTHFSLYALAD